MPKTASAQRRQQSRARKAARRRKLIVPAWLHSIIMTEILTALREAQMKAFELYSRIKAKFADVRDHWVSTVLDEMAGKRHITVRRSDTFGLTPAGRAVVARMA